MKIPPRVREQAAIYCSARASWWAAKPDTWPYFAKFGRNVKRIADDAFNKAHSTWGFNFVECWAEAEALLRTGWEP